MIERAQVRESEPLVQPYRAVVRRRDPGDEAAVALGVERRRGGRQADREDQHLAELSLVEALRTLRILHYSAWLARRWDDPAFPQHFPWFDSPRYWEDQMITLREQIERLQLPSLKL